MADIIGFIGVCGLLALFFFRHRFGAGWPLIMGGYASAAMFVAWLFGGSPHLDNRAAEIVVIVAWGIAVYLICRLGKYLEARRSDT